jgi:formylglycine-generating enzyme required for sulfatase activity
VAAGACAKIPEHYLEPPPPPRHPVADVTLADAAAYCAWLGKQLPTEEQWEKAARGTDGRTYPWGNEPPSCERALYEDWTPDRGTDVCGDTHPNAMHPVGSHPRGASPYGALDMAGNAVEWTTGREGPYWVARGGRGFGHGVPIVTDQLRVTYRRLDVAEARDRIIGFRCVRTPKGRELPTHRD